MALHTLHLFAGAGGGILADLLLGHVPIAACEIEDYPRAVLLQRQLDGILPAFPIWDDIRTLRSDNPECYDAFNKWREIRDNLCVCGGFPCQDISAAGKGAGISRETRSGLWFEMARVIREIRPRFVFVENSPLLVSRGLGIVLGDLAEMGYDARWGVLGANNAGACHERSRIWIYAFNSMRFRTQGFCEAESIGQVRPWRACSEEYLREALENPLRGSGLPKPLLRRMDDGLADRVDRIKATGNGQSPIVAALAWKTLASF